MKQQICFGTDGIRGNANEYPFINDTLIHLGMAIAKWSIKKYKKSNPQVLIAHDTRISCPRIKEKLIKGLLSESIQIIDAHILPTPAVCQIIKDRKEHQVNNMLLTQ